MRVAEIFESIQGEAEHQGVPTTFIRLAGCNLNCKYCDTKYANGLSDGKDMSMGQIMDQVRNYGHKIVEITGGEPLLQYDDTVALNLILNHESHHTDIETNGSFDIRDLPRWTTNIIMDIKTPGSGMSDRMNFENISRLEHHDNLKFVIVDKDDLKWCKKIIIKYSPKCKIYFSPCIGYGDLKLSDVADFIVQERELRQMGFDIRYSLQIHKYIWHPDKRKV